jgi:hypothetical protein
MSTPVSAWLSALCLSAHILYRLSVLGSFRSATSNRVERFDLVMELRVYKSVAKLSPTFSGHLRTLKHSLASA